MARVRRWSWRVTTAKVLCLAFVLQMSPAAMGVPVEPLDEGRVWRAGVEIGSDFWQVSRELGVVAVGGTRDLFTTVSGSLDQASTPHKERLGEALQDLNRRGRVELAALGTAAVSLLPGPEGIVDLTEGATLSQELPPLPPRRAQGRASDSRGMTALPAGTEAGVGLLAGLNLVSLPLEPENTDPAAVLSPIVGQYSAVFAYDACDPADPWKIYEPGGTGNDLTVLDHRPGLWIDALGDTTLLVDGELSATTQIPLCTGWNLIGYPLGQPRPVRAALASIEGKYQRVFGFDRADLEDPWEIFDISVPTWANDLERMRPGRGYWVLVTEDTVLDYENVGAAPEVSLLAPADLSEVTAPTEVRGTVRSNSLERWTLSFAPSGEPGATFTEIAKGNAPGTDLALGTFDPTLLLNGMVDLKLTAVDFAGQTVEDTITVTVEGQMKIGHFTLSFTDLSIPLSGLDIEILRTYDSRDKMQRDFGVGWSLDIKQGTYRNNRPPGEGWQIVSGGLGGSPCKSIVERKSHSTTIRLSDQETYRFKLKLVNPGVQLGGCFATAGFDYVDGPLPGTTLEILGNKTVFHPNGSEQVVDLDTQEVFEPRRVRLVTRDGRTFDLDLEAGVTRLGDLNGGEVQISPTSIVHSGGVSISLERDGEGRITRITDPVARVMTYSYDSRGDLVGAVDRAGNLTTMTYGDLHDLRELIDPLGNRAVRNEYDAAGRLTSTTDASGRTISLERNLGARREVITDRLGFVQVFEYDARGNVVREIDKLGNSTSRTFDGEDNLLTESDPLGRVTSHTYTAANDLASVTDPLGNTTAFTYDGSGRILSTTSPRGKVTRNVYDSRGNLLSVTDAAGNVKSFTYDASGRRLSETDSLGNVATFAFDSAGNLTREVDASGNETLYSYNPVGDRLSETRTRALDDGSTESLSTVFTYDALGRLSTTTFPDGTTTSQTYDALGRILSETDELGRVTRFTFDSRGRQTGTVFPDGTAELQTYDDEGRLVSVTDRGGRVTGFTYDAVGRLLTTTAPDGGVIVNAYDEAGQLIALTDARGNTTTYEYDGAGRRTAVVDPLGHRSVTAYDASGNAISATDALGQTTVFSFDDLDRRTGVTFPDGSATTTAYDGLGRRIAETDPAGRVTRFAYDPLGQLAAVTDALGQVTAYTYDEVGNLRTQADAHGNVSRFSYDSVGRQIARVLPGGDSAHLSYNSDGTVASRTDFNGATTTYEYDVDGREILRHYPDGSQVAFSYTPTGQRAGFTDQRGTTTFTYDTVDRVTSKVLPDGRALSYAYDAAGNRLSMTATVGTSSFTTSYGYDELNRLVAVTDSRGGVTAQSYDPNGNLSDVRWANGLTSTHSFDILNRLTRLSLRDGLGVQLESYAYSLAVTGHRTRIDELDGTSRIYAYDPLDRLLEDRVEDGNAALIYRQAFTYDAVGNRLNLSDDRGGGPTSTAHAYDARDRLISEGSAAYGWDRNGNLTSKSGTGGASYSWDFENRLTSVRLADGTEVRHTYDPDGVRVRTEVLPPDGSTPLVTDYLNDTSGFLSHVVAERREGVATVVYTRADERLVSLFRSASGSHRYFHSDGTGSIRLLTDEAGSITDRYAYTAFGEEMGHTGSDEQPYRFAAEPYDPNSGFYYNRARWLDVGVGRFVSPDPFAGSVQDPESLHRYLYAAADPVNQRDPSGLFSATINFSLANTIAAITAAAIVGIQTGAFRQVGEALYEILRTTGLEAQRLVALAVSSVAAAKLAQDRARYQERYERWKKKHRKKRILFHYTTEENARSIVSSNIILGQQGTHGPGAYATNLRGWLIETQLRRFDLVKRLFGNDTAGGYAKTAWFVAFIPDPRHRWQRKPLNIFISPRPRTKVIALGALPNLLGD